MNDSMIAKMETLENCIKINYLRIELGWTMEQVSYELNFNPRQMTEWINSRAAAITQLVKTDPVAVERLKLQLSKDYPPPKPEEAKKLKLDVIRVAKCLKEGKNLREIAKIFRCEENDYRIWHNENLGLINQRMKKV